MKPVSAVSQVLPSEAARVVVRRIVLESVTFRDRRYYPYRFDWIGSTAHPATIHAPWYSALAQGEVLSLLVALAEVTGRLAWRTAD